MAKKTPETLLKEANARLKAGKIRVRIATRAESDRLYLRATLPPKPSSGKAKAYQQRISLGVYFNPAGIKRAEAEAQKLNYVLMLNQFSWDDWRDEQSASRTVSKWISAFEADYFTRRKRNPKTETTWTSDYYYPFNRLPQDLELTAAVLESTAVTYPPDSRSRLRACNAYGALARFAKIDAELKTLRGSYSPTTVTRDQVPNDALILEWVDKISNTHWQNFYKLCACYGLRNHEAFYVDLDKLKSDPLAVVQDGKTGYRIALPCPLGWWEMWFKGQDIALPKLTVKHNSGYGNRSSRYFRRALDLPFKIYDLRHAHAGRMELKGIGGSIAAKAQGHSLEMHSNIYLNYLGESELRQVLERLR